MIRLSIPLPEAWHFGSTYCYPSVVHLCLARPIGRTKGYGNGIGIANSESGCVLSRFEAEKKYASVAGRRIVNICTCNPPTTQESIADASKFPTMHEPIIRSNGREHRNVFFGNRQTAVISAPFRWGNKPANTSDGTIIIATHTQSALLKCSVSAGGGKEPAIIATTVEATTSGIQNGLVSNVFI